MSEIAVITLGRDILFGGPAVHSARYRPNAALRVVLRGAAESLIPPCRPTPGTLVGVGAGQWRIEAARGFSRGGPRGCRNQRPQLAPKPRGLSGPTTGEGEWERFPLSRTPSIKNACGEAGSPFCRACIG